MQIIDVQVHSYEPNTPRRPWAGRDSHGPDKVTAEIMVAEMEKAGVDGALLVSPYVIYGFDPSYALEAAAKFPERFAVITPVDYTRPDVTEFMAEWAKTPHTVGVRMFVMNDVDTAKVVAGAAEGFLKAAARHNQPVCVACFGRLREFAPVFHRHPDVQFAIDHLGLMQPLVPPAPPEPFAQLPLLLALADCPNVAVKVSGVPTLSHQGYPYPDIWPPLLKIVDAFGVKRLMWGSDWTRATGFFTWKQATDAFTQANKLAPTDLEWLMGGSLRSIFGWAPGAK